MCLLACCSAATAILTLEAALPSSACRVIPSDVQVVLSLSLVVKVWAIRSMARALVAVRSPAPPVASRTSSWWICLPRILLEPAHTSRFSALWRMVTWIWLLLVRSMRQLNSQIKLLTNVLALARVCPSKSGCCSRVAPIYILKKKNRSTTCKYKKPEHACADALSGGHK